MSQQQSTTDVLMIRPAAFCANTQTAASNRFQNVDPSTNDAQSAAVAEFDALARVLRDARVRVHVVDDTSEPIKPDALFPNNWVSFHADGVVAIYPMLAPNRRLERRMDVLEALSTAHGFRIERVIDLSHLESQEKFLEGTGSLVLDRVHRRAYACLSSRTHPDALGEFAQLLDYDIVAFEAADASGTPIYHTNVMMSIGSAFAAVCLEAIRADQRDAVARSLTDTGHKIVELTQAQINAFAGNILELATTDGGHIVALSQRADDALTPGQRDLLRTTTGPLVPAPIPTIERLGGGSVRCMLAEVFLPRK
jgi:hypothetical protein